MYMWVYADERKYWRLRYWIAGKEKSLSLGVYPDAGLKASRKKRDAERDHLNNQIDPSAERKADKRRTSLSHENSFESVADEWFEKQKYVWVAIHAFDERRRLDKNVYPFLGRRPIMEIDAPELIDAIWRIESRGANDLSHRAL